MASRSSCFFALRSASIAASSPAFSGAIFALYPSYATALALASVPLKPTRIVSAAPVAPAEGIGTVAAGVSGGGTKSAGATPTLNVDPSASMSPTSPSTSLSSPAGGSGSVMGSSPSAPSGASASAAAAASVSPGPFAMTSSSSVLAPL